jgi:hypothetical protein
VHELLRRSNSVGKLSHEGDSQDYTTSAWELSFRVPFQQNDVIGQCAEQANRNCEYAVPSIILFFLAIAIFLLLVAGPDFRDWIPAIAVCDALRSINS